MTEGQSAVATAEVVVEAAPHDREAPVSGIVERALGLCSPQPVFLGHQLLDLRQYRLVVHVPRISRDSYMISADDNYHSG